MPKTFPDKATIAQLIFFGVILFSFIVSFCVAGKWFIGLFKVKEVPCYAWNINYGTGTSSCASSLKQGIDKRNDI